MSDSTSDFDFDFDGDPSDEGAEARAARRDRPDPTRTTRPPRPGAGRPPGAERGQDRAPRRKSRPAASFDPTVPSKREQETNGGDVLDEPGNGADPARPLAARSTSRPTTSTSTSRSALRQRPSPSAPALQPRPGDGAFFADTGEEPFADDAPSATPSPTLSPPATAPAAARLAASRCPASPASARACAACACRSARGGPRPAVRSPGVAAAVAARSSAPGQAALRLGDDGGRRKKGKIKKLRLLIIIIGLSLLALVSTFFGMMMAVSSDLPDLENRTEYKASENSVVYDVTGRKLGTLTNNNNRILVESSEITQSMKQAAVAIEDKRFYEHSGVDFQGMFRAAIRTSFPEARPRAPRRSPAIRQERARGAGQSYRLREVREAALAYHLENKWDKDKILTQYLNTIYFGEGAYGIEAAAETYFGWNHPNCGQDGYPRCASLLLPEESAMLAGIIASPSAFSPRANPQAALDRRNLVLQDMADQGYLTQADADTAKLKPLAGAFGDPGSAEDSLSPYFTTWLRQILVDRYGAGEAFGGGLGSRRRSTTTSASRRGRRSQHAGRRGADLVDRRPRQQDRRNPRDGRRPRLPGPSVQPWQPTDTVSQDRHSNRSRLSQRSSTATARVRTYTSAPQQLPVPNSGGHEVFKVAKQPRVQLARLAGLSEIQRPDASRADAEGGGESGVLRISTGPHVAAARALRSAGGEGCADHAVRRSRPRPGAEQPGRHRSLTAIARCAGDATSI